MKFFLPTLRIALLATAANAHMVLLNPVPFNNGSVQNAPLDPNGADFPCKFPTGYKIVQMNNWKAGETQTVRFMGSAVHGGGSCQFSITTDKEPTKQSQWKVIHSVIGGCPSNVEGNLTPETPLGTGANTFPVTMPKDTPNGQYTFSWSWLNKVGNREYYQNCAPIMVSGGVEAASQEASSAFFAKLPDMFVINLPNSTCGTVETQDFVYPQPGDSVVTGVGAALGSSIVDNGGCSSMFKMGAGAGTMGSPAKATGGGGASSAAPTGPVATSVLASLPATSNPGGIFAPGASSAAGGPQTSFTTLVVTTTASLAEPTAAPSPTGAAPAAPAASGNCVACTNDGGVVCIGSNQFGLCNRGCAVPQALAAGMSCSNGAITRRTARGRRVHLHRRHGSEMI
ncbi:uncharacterized protein BDR25DRAFT_347618 [Lindgomyces ingoldianus]|uniref:Uncharacterized protein n=1 Tax=Lindgomyces ingoldianus TaxID=673940 RepID=A0ACB6Q866_9PLEO|nr:uncharacterized protein BDR25DRAFT_347618 [Lindgomyces ingoldianus]KAF2462773.1 hypothetical protein BDR25DRAFT_347618 [Lindgomyces ingoldianus]